MVGRVDVPGREGGAAGEGYIFAVGVLRGKLTWGKYESGVEERDIVVEDQR